jgi:hypothetical protein
MPTLVLAFIFVFKVGDTFAIVAYRVGVVGIIGYHGVKIRYRIGVVVHELVLFRFV